MNSYYHDDLVASEELGEGLLAQGAPVLVGFVPIVAELECAGLAAEGEAVVDHHLLPFAESPKPKPENTGVIAGGERLVRWNHTFQ